jgi:hypothetical protein
MCPVHEDYIKVRNKLVGLFTKKTIYSLVKAANKQENILI